MNCFNHDNVPAVAICKECGRAMCYDCAMVGGKYDSKCPECKSDHFKIERKKNRKKIAKVTVITAIIAIIGAVVAILLGLDTTTALLVAGGIVVVVFLVTLFLNLTKGGKVYKKVQEIINPNSIKKKKTAGVVTVVGDSEEISTGRMSTNEDDGSDLYENMP